MAAEYFLYNTNYENILIDRSNLSFVPLPPDTGEIHIDFFIPEIQPLYFYRESGTTIILTEQDTIDDYLFNTLPNPTKNDIVKYEAFTGYTSVADVKFINIENSVTGLSASVDTRFADIDDDITGLTNNFNIYTGSTGLGEVTAINAETDIESTFNGGLVVNKIRPTGDTITAIQINKADGITSVINVDTISGFTGFGTEAPTGLIHAYGTDNSEGENIWDIQKNSIVIDGPLDTDKVILWSQEGVPKWGMMTFRDENGEFLYLKPPEIQNIPLIIANTGIIGFNKITNVMADNPIMVINDGLDDLHVNGLYTLNHNTIYEIEINDTGATDTYHWRKSIDNGLSYNTYSSTSAVTITAIELEHGVLINFDNISGHTIGSLWRFAAFAQMPQATVSVAPMGVAKVMQTTNYNAGTIIYNDITELANGGIYGNQFNVLYTGVTSIQQAFYWGMRIPINSIYFNMAIYGESIILVTEYWDGTTWIALTSNDDYIDGTNNLTNSGKIYWSSQKMINWNIHHQLPDTTGDEYKLHWMRIRTSTNATIIPMGNSLSVGTDKRFSIYNAFDDYRPSYYIDSRGRVQIGGGNITDNNMLQIGNFLNVTNTSDTSLVEIDSEDSDTADLKIKLSSDDDKGEGLLLTKSRGNLVTPTSVQYGDTIGYIKFRAHVNTCGREISNISGIYTGDGNTTYGNLLVNIANGSEPIEKIRITNDGTGFGIIPSAIIHIQSGSTSIAPFKFTSGAILSIPEAGVVEFMGDNWYGTITGDTRKTFAFLESPTFIGAPELPVGTTLNTVNLNDYILNSGGTNNNLLILKTDFNLYTGDTDTRLDGIDNDITYISGVTDTKLNTIIFETYTGGTIPWDKVNKTGSDLADIQTKNAADVDISVSSWNSNNVDDVITKFVQYINETEGSGRISPTNVGFGLLTNILKISGGTGYITYDNFHKKITWTGCTFNVSGYSEGLYYAYVDVNSVVHIIDTKPDGIHNIVLVEFYFGGVLIGVIKQCGCLIENALTRTYNYLDNLGVFIIDDNGLVQILSGGDNLKLISPSCKLQQGLLLLDEPEISSNDALSLKYMADYVSIDQKINANWYFSKVNEGKVITDRWNDVTKKSKDILTGYTAVFTNGSNLVTSTSDLTSFISSDDYIYLSTSIHSELDMTPVSGITWTGTETQITLDTNYSGATGSGTTGINHAMPKIPSGKYVKTGIFRSVDGQMILVIPQQYHNTEDDARDSSLALLSDCLEGITIKMAYLVYIAGETDLTGKIYDIRPLPFHYKEGGQIGGGVITSHGDLSGLSVDDHTQYLKTDGTRNITGIQQYQIQQTFTNDLDIVSKKYIDDVDALNLNISTFSAFTGTTLPATYLTITDFNAFTGTTTTILAGIESKINYISGVTDTKLDTTIFNAFTGSTIPILANIESKINYVSGQTDLKLFISDFDTFTGTTLPTNYYNKTEINSYTGATATEIGLKAPITNPVFLVSAKSITPSINDNTICIATTAWYVGQRSTANPLMDGTVAVGTSMLFTRQDHVHPKDTSKQNIITGASTTILDDNLTINRTLISNDAGKVAVSTITSTELSYLSGITSNIKLQIDDKIDKVTGATNNVAIFDVSGNVKDSGVNVSAYGSEYQLASSLASSTTTLLVPQTKVSMTTSNLPAGTYKIVAAWLGSHTSISNDMLFDITLNGTPQGTRTTTQIEIKDTTTVYPFVRIFYLSLSGVNTILLRYWNESNTTTISDATIELIRVT